MESRNRILFVKERNEMLFQSTIQAIFDDLSDLYNIEVQYQCKNDKDTSFFTAAIKICRIKIKPPKFQNFS